MGFEAGKPQVSNGARARGSKESLWCPEVVVGPHFGPGCSPRAGTETWATWPPTKRSQQTELSKKVTSLTIPDCWGSKKKNNKKKPTNPKRNHSEREKTRICLPWAPRDLSWGCLSRARCPRRRGQDLVGPGDPPGPAPFAPWGEKRPPGPHGAGPVAGVVPVGPAPLRAITPSGGCRLSPAPGRGAGPAPPAPAVATALPSPPAPRLAAPLTCSPGCRRSS